MPQNLTGSWTATALLGVSALFFIAALPIMLLIAARNRLLRGDARGDSGWPLIGSILGVLALMNSPVSRQMGWWVFVAPFAVEAGVRLLICVYWYLSGMGAEWKRLRKLNEAARTSTEIAQTRPR